METYGIPTNLNIENQLTNEPKHDKLEQILGRKQISTYISPLEIDFASLTHTNNRLLWISHREHSYCYTFTI